MSTFFLQFLLSFLFVNKTLRLNNLKTRTGMNEKNSMFCICVEAIIYLLLYNQHDCTFSSVPYDFHYLILCNQTSNLIIITILNANMQYIFIHKKLWGVLLEARHLLFDLVLLMFMLRLCINYLSTTY